MVEQHKLVLRDINVPLFLRRAEEFGYTVLSGEYRPLSEEEFGKASEKHLTPALTAALWEVYDGKPCFLTEQLHFGYEAYLRAHYNQPPLVGRAQGQEFDILRESHKEGRLGGFSVERYPRAITFTSLLGLCVKEKIKRGAPIWEICQALADKEIKQRDYALTDGIPGYSFEQELIALLEAEEVQQPAAVADAP